MLDHLGTFLNDSDGFSINIMVLISWLLEKIEPYPSLFPLGSLSKIMKHLQGAVNNQARVPTKKIWDFQSPFYKYHFPTVLYEMVARWLYAVGWVWDLDVGSCDAVKIDIWHLGLTNEPNGWKSLVLELWLVPTCFGLANILYQPMIVSHTKMHFLFCRDSL